MSPFAPAPAQPSPAEFSLSELSLSELSLSEIVGFIERSERARRIEDARRLRWFVLALERVLAAASGRRELAYRSLRAELASALTLGEHTIDRELSLADALTRRYRAALAALDAGEIAKEHARVLVDEGTPIGAGDDSVTLSRRKEYEQAVLAAAQSSTPNQLRPIARRLAESWAETTIDERHREAAQRRRVTVTDAGDGMADLLAHLPLIEAVAIRDRLTRIARAAERGEREVRSAEERRAAAPGGPMEQPEAPDLGAEDREASGRDALKSPRSPGPPEPGEAEQSARSRDQVRVDAFVELLLGADVFSLTAGSAAEAISARVQVIVPVTSLTGTGIDIGTGVISAGIATTGRKGGSGIAELAGFGPVTLDAARDLAAHAAHWEATGTHPDTGAVLSVDRYRPSAEMRRLLGARDLTCRFPGCRVPVHRCDFDHTVDAAHGGPTSTENLAALCRGHHTLKHRTDWTVQQLGGGVLRWISPTGRVRVTHPPAVSPAQRQGTADIDLGFDLGGISSGSGDDPHHPPDRGFGRSRPRPRTRIRARSATGSPGAVASEPALPF